MYILFCSVLISLQLSTCFLDTLLQYAPLPLLLGILHSAASGCQPDTLLQYAPLLLFLAILHSAAFGQSARHFPTVCTTPIIPGYPALCSTWAVSQTLCYSMHHSHYSCLSCTLQHSGSQPDTLLQYAPLLLFLAILHSAALGQSARHFATVCTTPITPGYPALCSIRAVSQTLCYSMHHSPHSWVFCPRQHSGSESARHFATGYSSFSPGYLATKNHSP
jgi:hypothetical protein